MTGLCCLNKKKKKPVAAPERELLLLNDQAMGWRSALRTLAAARAGAVPARPAGTGTARARPGTRRTEPAPPPPPWRSEPFSGGTRTRAPPAGRALLRSHSVSGAASFPPTLPPALVCFARSSGSRPVWALFGFLLLSLFLSLSLLFLPKQIAFPSSRLFPPRSLPPALGPSPGGSALPAPPPPPPRSPPRAPALGCAESPRREFMEIVGCRAGDDACPFRPPAMLFHGISGGHIQGIMEEMERRSKGEARLAKGAQLNGRDAVRRGAPAPCPARPGVPVPAAPGGGWVVRGPRGAGGWVFSASAPASRCRETSPPRRPRSRHRRPRCAQKRRGSGASGWGPETRVPEPLRGPGSPRSEGEREGARAGRGLWADGVRATREPGSPGLGSDDGAFGGARKEGMSHLYFSGPGHPQTQRFSGPLAVQLGLASESGRRCAAPRAGPVGCAGKPGNGAGGSGRAARGREGAEKRRDPWLLFMIFPGPSPPP